MTFVQPECPMTQPPHVGLYRPLGGNPQSSYYPSSSTMYEYMPPPPYAPPPRVHPQQSTILININPNPSLKQMMILKMFLMIYLICDHFEFRFML
ncbi:hypothetical protein RD792_008435 [Penstemon davidsonii]|uniref:Uncharacterized protein n=1 Tax=Penstemon davidsonii TaxID=160366 RepID=A0ABR0DAG5_9LAMI|nr:hypothetical protein RD792_008435 [Penstemon davidsonii]